MPKLNDTQAILLSTASQRDGGSLHPLPATLADAGDRVTKALAALIRHGLAEERETSDAASGYRYDGDLRYGMFITDAGIVAIDAGPVGEDNASTPAALRSKSAAVVALLKCEAGATLAELIEATGWLPHTVRAALTGLRKKGHAIERSKRDDATCYRIVTAA